MAGAVLQAGGEIEHQGVVLLSRFCGEIERAGGHCG